MEDKYLFVLLSFDTLYSINLKDLKNCKLETVFSHLTNKQPNKSSYPLGMGLFVTHGHGGSKLHFFGGENLEDRSIKVEDRSIDRDMAYKGKYLNKRPKRPMKFSIYQMRYLSRNKTTITETPQVEVLNWLNNKVFSFTPVVLNDKQQVIITPDVESDTSTQQIPDHFSYKVRPVVVNMLSKIYVLTTRPYSTRRVKNYGLFGRQILFEVFDPKKGNWRRLPNPPVPLSREILGHGDASNLIISHCVYKTKLLLETEFGQYLFDAIAEKWETIPSRLYPTILASLEYKNILLAFVKLGESSRLVAYDLAIFGEEHYSTSRDYISILDIETEDKSYIYAASLNIVENNCICLVLNVFPTNLHIYLFDVIIKPYSVKAERMVYREFDLPQVLFSDEHILSTFVFPKEKNDVEESNQTCNGESETGNREEKEDDVGMENDDLGCVKELTDQTTQQLMGQSG